MNRTLAQLIFNFRDFVCKSWKIVKDLESMNPIDSFIDDWLQGNWELLVESSVAHNGERIFLEVYGNGADANGSSSRILFPEELPNKKIVVCPRDINVEDLLNGNVVSNKGIVFDRLVCFRDGWYFEEPPFDKVLAYDQEKEFVVKMDDVDFHLKDING